jgi:putative ABC transport system permease protein
MRERGTRTPLAWLSLWHDRRRLFSSVAGVAFAVLLMFAELAFLNGFYDSSLLPITKLDADLVMISHAKQEVNDIQPFHRARLVQARQVEGVASTVAVYQYVAVWRTPERKAEELIRVFAFDPGERAFTQQEVEAQRELLRTPETVLFDRKARDLYGRPGIGSVGELGGRRVNVVGLFPLGPDFAFSGSALMSDREFARYFPSAPGVAPALDRVAFGLIRLAPEADAGRVLAALRSGLSADVEVMTKTELLARAKTFVQNNSAVSAIFGLGLIVGFAIGIMICYQILFTDIMDHLHELATLKAIGYSNGYLRLLAIKQGFYLGVISFLLALPVGFGVYAALEHVSGLIMILTPGRALMVFVLTVVMCVIAGQVASRRALKLDPAELF